MTKRREIKIDAGNIVVSRESRSFEGSLVLELLIRDNGGNEIFSEWFDPEIVHFLHKQFRIAAKTLTRSGYGPGSDKDGDNY